MVREENEREKDHPVIGDCRIEDADDPEKNPLHPNSLTDKEVERFGECHKMAKKFAEENEGADFYTSTNSSHSMAVKDGMVYDFVLGYNLDISVED